MRWTDRSAAVVLIYHGVSAATSSGEKPVNTNHVDVRDFRWQVDFLRRHYTVVPLAEIIGRVRRGASIDRLAAITFDDGYLNVYDNAAPVLRDLGLSATTFVIAGCVEDGGVPWYDRVEAHVLRTRKSELVVGGTTYALADRRRTVGDLKRRLKASGPEERDRLIEDLASQAGPLRPIDTSPYALMSWAQMRELQASGMDFGAHTYTHPHLSKIPPGSGRLEFEIDESSRLISERLSIPMQQMIFCYPDGDYNKAARDRVEALGLAGAVAVKNRPTRRSDDPFALPRVAVAGGDSRATFEDGTVGFTQRLKAAFISN